MVNNVLKIIPLGGVAQVTKNLFVYEFHGEREEILLVDCGIGFPSEEMLGIDYLFPDVSYLVKNKEKIKGIVLTHGHNDHLAGLPYLLDKIGPLPIFATRLTAGFCQNALRNKGKTANINLLEKYLQLGDFRITAIPVTHSVPDSCHLFIETPAGNVYHGSDFKFDFTPIDGRPSDLGLMAKAAETGIDLLLSDCVRVEKDGYSLSEVSLYEVFERELRECRGRFILTTMSSNINRIQQIVKVAAEFGRKIAFIGRSLHRNVRTAEELGYLNFPRELILSKKAVLSLPKKQQAYIVTGCQAEPNAALVRLADGKEVDLKLETDDKVVFSADPIPGNEGGVNLLIDKLTSKGVVVSYKGILDDLHVSGHASSGDLSLLISLLRPRYLLPIGGTFRQMTRFSQLAQTLNFKREQVFLPEEGRVLNIEDHRVTLGEKIFLEQIIVDGRGVGDVGRLVLQERSKMAEDGMVVVVLVMSKNQLFSVKIISRGFVFVRESQALLNQAEDIVRKLVKTNLKEIELRKEVEKRLQRLFFKETEREPLILSLVIHL